MGAFKMQSRDYSPTNGVIYRVHYRGNETHWMGDVTFDLIVGGEIILSRPWAGTVDYKCVDQLYPLAMAFSEYVFTASADEDFSDGYCHHDIVRCIADVGLDLVLVWRKIG